MQVRALADQTEVQIALRKDAASPRIWADIRPDSAQGTLLKFHVGNAGTSTATAVRVFIDPELPAIASKRGAVKQLQTTLATGLSSLAPGRELAWVLGQGFEILKAPGPAPVKVRIEGEGPFGPLDPQEFVIDPTEWKEIHDQPTGSFHEVRKAIDRLSKNK